METIKDFLPAIVFTLSIGWGIKNRIEEWAQIFKDLPTTKKD